MGACEAFFMESNGAFALGNDEKGGTKSKLALSMN
jgi:hypothetical protein